MVTCLCIKLTLGLLVLLSQFFYDLSLLLNFFLQTVVGKILLKEFFLFPLLLFDQCLLPLTLFLKFQLELSLLASLLFLGLLEGGTSLDELCLHVLHQLL